MGSNDNRSIQGELATAFDLAAFRLSMHDRLRSPQLRNLSIIREL